MTSDVENKGLQMSGADKFDADWYQATYPDVALSGLSPQDHFLKFGRIMGRAANAQQRAERLQAAPSAPDRRAESFAKSSVAPSTTPAEAFQAGAPVPEALTSLAPNAQSPIIAAPPTPPNFKPLAPTDLARPTTEAGLAVRAGALDIARAPDAPALDRIAAPLAAYCRLFSPDRAASNLFTFEGAPGMAEQASADFASHLERGADPGGQALQNGPVQIANAWFTDEFGLRVFLSDIGEDAARIAVLRAYQAAPEAPENLHLVGGLSLAGQSLGVFDLALLNPLMPVLFELADENGLTLEMGLLPFPSLLRGGLHAAERAALQLEPDPMAEVWRLSRALLAELCPATDLEAPLAISAIKIATSKATGAERGLSEAFRGWLRAVFDLVPAPLEEAAPTGPGARYVFDMLSAADPVVRGSDGLALELSATAVPTLGALVSRRLALPEGQELAAGPFLVADTVSCRPQWSVALPLSETDMAGDVPCLRSLQARTSVATERDFAGAIRHNWLAPLHLAIRFASPIPVKDIQTVLATAPETPVQALPGAQDVSLVLQVTDLAHSERFLVSLAGQHASRVSDIVLCLSGAIDPGAAQQMVQGVFPGLATRMLTGTADLDQIAGAAAGDAILLAEDSVILYDPRTLSAVSKAFAADPEAASVSCVLLHEAVQKGRGKVQVASAGIFPGPMSFITAPRLGVVEPDCLAALPDATYPVLANTFRFCLIRRSAITDTQAARAGLPKGGASADLKFGLDAFVAGYRNLCISHMRAGTTAPASRRDEMDPFGLACVLPASWDDLLGSVTVLRELRG